MANQNCFSLRPGTKFGFQGFVWRVTDNDTLNMTFTAVRAEKGIRFRKTFRYRPGQEIEIRWKPDERI